MKAKTFSISISLTTDEPIDEADLNDRVLQALRSPAMPVGQARVDSTPIDVELTQPFQKMTQWSTN